MSFTNSTASEGQITLTDVRISDENGKIVLSVGPRSTVSVQSTFTTDLGPAVTHVVQVTDHYNRVVFLAETDLQIATGEYKQIETTWQAQEQGNHTLQVFVWPDLKSPPNFDVSIHSVQVFAAGTDITCRGVAACLRGTVTNIVDGDTIDVSSSVRVRLSLVNTPERGEQGYQEATLFTSKICPEGADVLVDEDDGQRSGSYGRMVAKVFCDGELLNEKLLETGNAIILKNFCGHSEFGREAWAAKFGC